MMFGANPSLQMSRRLPKSGKGVGRSTVSVFEQGAPAMGQQWFFSPRPEAVPIIPCPQPTGLYGAQPVRLAPSHVHVRAVQMGQVETVPPMPSFERGRVGLNLQEAVEIVAQLDEILRPVEAGEAQMDVECVRSLSAGPFPIVARLRDRMRQFVATAREGEVFELSHGEIEVADKAIACAEELGRIKTKKIVTTAAVGGGAVALLFLLL